MVVAEIGFQRNFNFDHFNLRMCFFKMLNICKCVVIILLLTSLNGAKGLECDSGCPCANINKTMQYSDNTVCMQIPHRQIPTSVTHLQIRGAICNLKKMFFQPNTCIRNLDLSFCNISEIDQNVFSTVKGLVVLKLSNNVIDYISDDTFSDLNQLEELFLDGNGIKVIMEGSLKSLQSLKIIDLANNHLLEMPGELPSTLIEINIMNNEIERISTEKLNNMIQLEVFQLSGNYINDWPDGDFFPKLRKLSLGDKIVTSSNKISNLPRIDTLHLAAKKLNMTKMKETLAEKISSLKSLQNLCLENYEISTFSFLENLINLTSLHLRNIYYTNEDLKSFPTNLTTLIINSSAHLTNLLLQSSHVFHRLITLSLPNNQIKTISNIQSEHLMVSLKSLNISSNPLDCSYRHWTWLFKKIQDNNEFLTDSNNVKCNEPSSLKDKKLSEALHFEIFTTDQPHEMKESNYTTNFTAKRHQTQDSAELYYGIIIFFAVVIPFLAVITCCNNILSKFHEKSLDQTQTNVQFTCSTGKTEIRVIEDKSLQLNSEINAEIKQNIIPQIDSTNSDESNYTVNNNQTFDP